MRTDAERILVLPPTVADAALTRSILAEAGLGCEVCESFERLGHEVARGAGAVLLTEDTLASPGVRGFADVHRAQPAWSDMPIVLLASSGADSSAAARATDLFDNVTVLERPARVSTLVSTLRSAIRARRRQYQIRDQLAELRDAESHLRRHGERLRLLWSSAAAILAHDEPDAMMKALFATIAPHLALDAYLNFAADEVAGTLRLESSAGIDPEQAASVQVLPMGSGPCGRTAQTREIQLLDRTAIRDDPGAEAVRAFGFHAYLCSPLVAQGRLLGTLAFASRRQDRFAPEDVEFLLTIANDVAGAYERLRLIGELRESDRRKDEFLATLAHELRNPLAPIRNALAILAYAGSADPTVRETRALMERQLAQMVRLIDDLLDLSRITRGKLVLRKTRIDLADVIASAIEAARPAIDEAGHALAVSLPAQPLPLDADAVRLSQVFQNLLTNATKYTDPGGRIAVDAAIEGRQVRLRMRDSGIGIPRAALSTIFDMFAQVDDVLERAKGGLGIGLTLVKRLTEMHGGRVEAESEGPGHGSTFVVTLPLAEGPVVPVRSGSAGAGPAEPSRVPALRILVADDNADAGESMATMLRMLGHEVRVTTDGASAVDEAVAFRPDVALLDIAMPGIDGYEAARRMRALPGGPRCLVAITGFGQDTDRRKAMAAGFDRHFTKPVDPEALQAVLAGAAAGRTSQPA